MSPGPASPRFASPLAHQEAVRPSVIPPAPLYEPAVPHVRARRSGLGASIWILGILALGLVALIGYFLQALGAGASLVGLVLACIPFAVVLFFVRIIDRWEPEPLRLLVLAVAWGAIAAVGLALLVDLGLTLAFGVRTTAADDVIQAVVQAPIVEELGKGLGVLLIFAIARRAFDGPVDGVVYGALVGAGFAFTENIQYFAVSFLQGGLTDVTATFFVRGILSPFAHAMFTAVIGVALGLAARRGASLRAALGPWLLGIVGAIALHAFWNGSAIIGDFFVLYLTLQVPLFVGFILGIVGLRREEARLTRLRLGEYATAGWFTPEEVEMLATPAGRRRGLAWSRTLRVDKSATMRVFIADATALAAARQRELTGRDPRAIDEERILLARTAAARAALLSR